MPTPSAELAIILEVQDRASQQLQAVGAQVQRLQQQVERSQRRGGGGGVLGGLLSGAGVGAGIQAIQGAFSAIGGFLGGVGESVFTLNSNLEQTTATFTALTGSVGAATAVVQALRREAATSPFSDADTLAAGRTLITVADGTTQSLLHLVQVAEQLAAIDPAQGLVGGAEALREAVSGDFQSIAERFELSRVSLERFKQSGLTNLQAVEAELQRLGVTSQLVEQLGRTFEGRLSTIRSFGDELRQRLGEGVFTRVSDFLGRVVRLIDQYGDRLRAWAEQLGETIGTVLERLASNFVGPLLSLLERVAPGITALFQGALAQAPEQMQQFAQAQQQAAQSGQTLERQLAGIGVQAAELQLQTNRVQQGYEAQLQPLQRQLELLQQSAALQRVQSQLTGVQAAQQRQRLELTVAALQRAAGGVTDPAGPDLTPRQRAIALARDEAQLQLEALNLQEAQRPQVEQLQQRIQQLQREQADALKPLQDQLQAYRDQADTLQIVRQTQQLAAQDAQDQARAIRASWTQVADPETLAAAKQRGQELADTWLRAIQDWINAGGGTVWGAIGKTLQDWYATSGKPLVEQVGTDLGAAMASAATAAFTAGLRKQIQDLLGGPAGVFLTNFLLGPAGGAAVAAGGGVLPVVQGAAGAVAPVVQVAPGAVVVNGQASPEQTEALRQYVQAVLGGFAQGLVTSQAGTDPGASTRVQGAGR